MKKKDKLIISHLRQDGRMQLTKMSKKTSIPVSTLFEKLKKYQGEIITKHTVLVDFSRIGYGTRAKVLLKVKKSQLKDLKEFLLKSSHTNELYRINNGFDFLVEFIFESMQGLEEYLDSVCSQFDIKKEQVLYVVKELKREEFLSKPHLLTFGRTSSI
jgi:DNA-binding Lrp family transcriptional regulator